MSNSNRKKNVLIMGGHDPSGAAGIQADIEAVTQAGCRAVSVITALTAQNTSRVSRVLPQPANAFDEQLKLLLEDIPVHACKLGMLGSREIIAVITEALSSMDVPVVLDPVLQSGTGTSLADAAVRQGLLDLLLPMTTIVTPNSDEARLLTKCDKLNEAAKILINKGARAVLITGTHEETEDVVNQLFLNDGSHTEYRWPRLPETYHGSGCTLASRIAACLALTNDLVHAVELAQDYTWHALKHSEQTGSGQWHPNRFFVS